MDFFYAEILKKKTEIIIERELSRTQRHDKKSEENDEMTVNRFFALAYTIGTILLLLQQLTV